MISSVCWIPADGCKNTFKRYEISMDEKDMMNDASLPDNGIMDDRDVEMEDDVTPENVEMNQDEDVDADDIESLSDAEDYHIKDTDHLLIVGSNEKDEDHSIQLQVYDPIDGNIFVHHCFPVPETPLCTEYIGGGSRNLVAVGMMSPAIEIWNLDIIDVLEPSITCGTSPDINSDSEDEDEEGQSSKVPLTLDGSNSHVGAVTDLSWIAHHNDWLLSCSSDSTVKLWDIGSGECIQNIKHHQQGSQVQAIEWNPTEFFVGASAGSDKYICLFDTRSTDKQLYAYTGQDIEQISFNPHNPAVLGCVLGDGSINFYDVRMLSKSLKETTKPLLSFQPHTESTVFSFNPMVENVVATGSFDERVHVWALEGSEFVRVCTREMKIGAVLDIQYLPGSKYVLAAGGSEGYVAIWDTEENGDLSKRIK